LRVRHRNPSIGDTACDIRSLAAGTGSDDDRFAARGLLPCGSRHQVCLAGTGDGLNDHDFGSFSDQVEGIVEGLVGSRERVSVER
jgi:hypothetical protein